MTRQLAVEVPDEPPAGSVLLDRLGHAWQSRDGAPRDVQAAIRQMNDACGMKELAERAFFRFNRAGSTVSGRSVHLARELARCWGNVHHGVKELRRDDEHGQSEMQAIAWDLEGNVRSEHIFIVPHGRDTKKGRVDLTDLRDIYENNANNAARRLREAIFSLLPVWYVEQAAAACLRTLEHGGGKPLPQRIAAAVEAFAALGVSEQQLTARVGRPPSTWTALDLAPLTVVHGSISRGEITKDEEFPPELTTVTVDELTPPPPAERKQRRRRDEPAEQPTTDEPAAGEA